VISGKHISSLTELSVSFAIIGKMDLSMKSSTLQLIHQLQANNIPIVTGQFVVQFLSDHPTPTMDLFQVNPSNLIKELSLKKRIKTTPTKKTIKQ